MDAETILIAKKFSGSADVSAAKRYKEAAEEAATLAQQSVQDYSDVLAGVNELEDGLEDLETRVTALEEQGGSHGGGSSEGGGSVSVTGDAGDIVRTNGNGGLYAGRRPVTKLLEVLVPDNVENDTSEVTWLTNGNGAVTGFVIAEDENGKTIDSYNHDHFLMTISNIINYITPQKNTASTLVWDVDYVNAEAKEKEDRNPFMYFQIPYANARQIKIDVGVNAAGSAYVSLEHGNTSTNGQIMPGGTVVNMGNRYQKNLNSDHVKAISFVLLTGTLTPLTVIRLWKA